MVRVISDGDGWLVLVDDVIRGRFGDVFSATQWARGWGF